MFLKDLNRKKLLYLLTLSLLALALGACGGGEQAEAPAEEAAMEEPWPPQLPGYAAMEVPADNPMTQEKVELGKMLYYDKRLSGDGNRSCYGCHLDEHGLATGDTLAIGAFDKTLNAQRPHDVERRLPRQVVLGRPRRRVGGASQGRLGRRKHGRFRRRRRTVHGRPLRRVNGDSGLRREISSDLWRGRQSGQRRQSGRVVHANDRRDRFSLDAFSQRRRISAQRRRQAGLRDLL